MAYDIQTGTINKGIRAEVVDAMVKQVAERTYKFMQAVAVVPTSSWKNTFFREDPTILTGQAGNLIKGIPRGANFPQQTIKWEEVSVRIVKHGIEDSVPWEDILAGDINIQARLVIKLTEGVVKSVDDDLWDTLTQTQGTNSLIRIQSYAISTAKYWHGSSAAIIDDLMSASRLISLQNYDVSNLMCFVSPRDKQSIMSYLASKGAQFPSIATDIANNGRIGKLAGITLVESPSVTASFAVVVVPKTCGTWKELVSLRSTIIEDPYRSIKIRVVQEGVCEVTDPLAIVLLKGTQGADGF